MGSKRLTLKRTLLLSVFFAIALFSTSALAQNDDDESTTPAARQSTTARTTAEENTPTPQPSETPDEEDEPEESTTSERTTETARPPALTTSTTTTPASPENTDDGELPPTLTRTYAGPIPTYPPPAIPPTNHAPFMNHSTLPDGTVFIIVGAILGAFGLAILAWRGIVACLLHRSVERAALAQHTETNKAASLPPPPASFYKFTDRDSSPSLLTSGGLAPGGGTGAKLNRKSYRGPVPSSTPSQTNLFFSPTAAPTAGAGASGGANRDSRFLPSGFYASASPAPGHGGSNSISLSNLRPLSRGQLQPTGPSPPDSPSVRAQSRNFSSSSINLNRPPSGRAPSAFLDDLLDDPAQQGQFPSHGGPSPFGPTQGYGQQHGQGQSRF